MEPTVDWATCDGVTIAYQVVGQGPPDILLLDLFFTQLDLDWDDPFRAKFLRRLARSARLIRFDRSGVGLSDRVLPAPEDAPARWANEAVAVLDAAGATTCRIWAESFMAPTGLVLAARHARRVERLAVVTGFAHLRGDAEFPGVADEVLEAGREIVLSGWGTGVMSEVLGQPGDELPSHQRRLDGRYERASIARRDLPQMVTAVIEADARWALGQVEAETLVVHRPNPFLPVAQSELLASSIDGARLVVVDATSPGAGWRYPLTEDDFFDDYKVALEFLVDTPIERSSNRRLLTMVFLDVVGSTPLAAKIGDREWAQLLEDFTTALNIFRTHADGRLVNSAGDGFFVVFESASRALEFADTLVTKASDLGLPIRVGVHVGECEVVDDDLRGLAVHAAARIMGLAEASEVLVSSLVCAVVDSEPFQFESRGCHELRGVPGQWELHALTGSQA